MDQTANTYLTTRVMSASPQELRLLLLEAGIKYARQASEGLRTKNFELSYNAFTQARGVAMELATGISEDADPDIAEKVRAVFLFIYRELMDASFEKSADKAARVAELFEYERDTWLMAMEHIAAEKRGGGQPGRDAGGSAARARPGAQPRPGATDGPRQGSLSIQA